jgi:P27 family predicted phage terminase small subunit
MPMPRKPAEVRQLEGRRGHKPVKDSPKFAPLLDDPPNDLGGHGREMWDRIMAAFEAVPVVQKTDYHALVALCREWQLYSVAMADLAARGHLVPSARDDGQLVKNPSAVVASQALGHWHKLAGRFGLTPADRAGLETPPVKPAELSPLEAVRLVTRRN